MLIPLITSAALAASPAKERDMDPRHLTDMTAYTVGKKQWQVGAWEQRYGLLDNFSLGTRTVLWPIGVPNIDAKVTAIQLDRFDVSLQGGWYQMSLKALNLPGTATLTPISWNSSWIATKRLSLHGGSTHTLLNIKSEMSLAELSSVLGTVTGSGGLSELPSGSGTYAGARFHLAQTNLAAEWRINGRDSLIFESNTYIYLTGLIAGGVSATEGATTTEVGASVSVDTSLKESIPTINTLAWQFSWDRLNLRVGTPLQPMKAGATWLYAIPQAFSLHWVLGPDAEET